MSKERMVSWRRTLVLACICNGMLVSCLPAPDFQSIYLTSDWLKPKETQEDLELLQSLIRVDDSLDRPNDYASIMFESGESDDQFSMLLYRLQNMEMRNQRLKLQKKTMMMEDNVLSRQKRKAKKSKERRRPSRCKPKSHERHGPRSREKHKKHGPRSREKHGRRGHKHGPKSHEKHGHHHHHHHHTREKHGPKHKHRSHEICPPDDEEITTPQITTLKSTTGTLPVPFSTTPTSKPEVPPFTTTKTERPNTGTTSISVDDGGTEDGFDKPYDGDASISYEDITFSPDAETLIPLL